MLTDKRLAFLSVFREYPQRKKVYPREKKALTFSRAEALFEQKADVQRHKKGLWKTEKLHKKNVCAVFDPSKHPSDGRQAAKNCLPAPISQIYFVKDSE